MTEARSALIELTLARFRIFAREPSAIFWTFGFPVILSVALGVAFRSRPPEPSFVAVADGPGARDVLERLAAPLVEPKIESLADAETDLRSGKVSLVVVPGPRPVYRYDPTRPESRLARLAVDRALARARGVEDAVLAVDQPVTAVGSRYVDFLIPGLVGLNVMSSSMWSIGYAIVEMRSKKLVKRFLATPMRRSDFLLSFVLMRVLFVFVEVPAVFGFAWLAFGVRVAGSSALLLGLSLIGATTFAGLGLLVAARADNTQTVGGLMNFVMMPMFIGSGVFFSTSHFPDAVQPWLRALPLTALNDGLRAISVEGAGITAIARPALVLVAWALAAYAGAFRLFRWR